MTNPQTLSHEQLKELYDECGGDAVKLAAKLGMSISEVAARATTVQSLPARRRQPPSDLGPDYYRRHIISIRHSEVPVWPQADQVRIESARMDYEAGTHEMCQARDRGWFVLYSIPRRKRTAPRKFFRTME